MSGINCDAFFDSQENLSLDDCDALLKFPYHDYESDIKREPDLPELGASGSLVLNKDDTCTPSVIPGLETFTVDSESYEHDSKQYETSLSKNKALQQKLVEALSMIEIPLQLNQTAQEEVEKKLNEQSLTEKSEDKLRKTKPISLFAAPYFRDVRGMVPPDNVDTVLKKKNCDVTAYLQPPKSWISHEKDKLMNGVGANSLSYLLKPFKAKRDFWKSKLKDPNLLDFDIQILKKNLAGLEKKIQKECARSFPEIIELAKDHIDWMTISATDLEGTRTDEECEMMWNNYLGLHVNKTEFSCEEDELLLSLAKKYKERDWDAISKELKTNRSPIQVFIRYQSHLNKALIKKYWTPEEDAKLMRIVETVRYGSFIPWNIVCSFMEGRTRHQVTTRYERTVCKDIKRSPWTCEEDAMLVACVKRYGCCWNKMKEFFPGRTCYGCRERYVNTLNPELRKGNWTKAEDEKLIELIKRHGYGKWARISREMPGRTDNMCLVRARRLQIHSKKSNGKIEIEHITDSEEIAKMLKPMAPSKHCSVQNAKLQEIRNKATECLRKALKEISSTLEESIDLETLDLSILGTHSLHKLYEQLQINNNNGTSSKWVPRYWNSSYRNPYGKRWLFKSKKRTSKQYTSGTDSASGEEDVDDPEENGYSSDELEASSSQVDSEERKSIKEILASKFEEYVAFGSQTTNKAVALNKKEGVECAIYETFLKQQLHCPVSPDEVDESSFNVGEIDYNASLSIAVKTFIQPPVNQDQFIVLAPNRTTLSGMDMILRTENRLRNTANFIDHSVQYVRYLTGLTDDPPKCVKCSTRGKAKTQQSTLDEFLDAMKKSKSLVIDDVMRRAAMVETQFVEDNKEEECVCEELQRSKAAVDLMSARFTSLFLWPYLLHSMNVTEKQEDLVHHDNPVKYMAYPKFKVEGDVDQKRKKTITVTAEEGHPRKKKRNEGVKKVGRPFKKSKLLVSPVRRSQPFQKSKLLVSPVRRSQRSSVLGRKSFAESDGEMED